MAKCSVYLHLKGSVGSVSAVQRPLREALISSQPVEQTGAHHGLERSPRPSAGAGAALGEPFPGG